MRVHIDSIRNICCLKEESVIKQYKRRKGYTKRDSVHECYGNKAVKRMNRDWREVNKLYGPTTLST